jgi:DNA invertase Pin-like site-specific DNA recombinase
MVGKTGVLRKYFSSPAVKKIKKVKAASRTLSRGSVGVIYTRTSSLGKKVVGSKSRQIQKSSEAATHAKVKIVKTVSEVTSGSLPADARQTLLSLLSGNVPGFETVKPGNLKVFVESARAIARDASVAEQLYQQSRKSGVQIVSADMPGLFSHQPTPAETFMRRVLLAVWEFDRDTILYRMAKGLDDKRKTSKDITQYGAVKVNGSKSIISKLKPTPAKLRAMKAAIRRYSNGVYGLRPLAEKLGCILKRKLAHETARRITAEVENKCL